MSRHNFAIVTGAGRSGSQWLLKLFDLHQQTHCRNEPDRIDEALQHPENAEVWESAIAHARTYYGITDLLHSAPKYHFHTLSQSLGLQKLMYRKRVWRMLGYGDDWQLPRWIGSRTKLQDAITILKIINARKAIVYLLLNNSPIPIIHLVRHPGGMLNSWNHRFLGPRDEQEIIKNQRSILHNQLKEWPEYAPLVGSLENMELHEAKLWCWRFAQERIVTVGDDYPNYLRIIYEELASNPIAILRNAYKHVGLDWPAADIEPRVRILCKNSTSIGMKWRNQLEPNEIACLKRVMRGSPLAKWWPDIL